MAQFRARISGPTPGGERLTKQVRVCQKESSRENLKLLHVDPSPQSPKSEVVRLYLYHQGCHWKFHVITLVMEWAQRYGVPNCLLLILL